MQPTAAARTQVRNVNVTEVQREIVKRGGVIRSENTTIVPEGLQPQATLLVNTAIRTPLAIAESLREPAAAAALLHISSRAIDTFNGDTLFELPARLEAFDMVAALWVRETLQAVNET